MTNNEFIEKVASYVKKYASGYGIKVHSPIIAQAILESGWGKSSLASKYHNYFGLKCGTAWKGKSVNLNTKEEYTAGTYTNITANFRVYDSMEEGIKGYFEFIQYDRYKNLKGITDPQKYLETIKADGYATSSKYVVNNMNLISQYNLTKYDKEETEMSRTADDLIKVMKSWIGYSEKNGKHKIIIDIYNGHKPLARGYKVKYTDAWCDTCVSAAAIKAGMTDLIGTECGCESHIAIFKKKGIWKEDGKITPQPGYIILYNWDDSTQPNDGGADHIGVVTAVKNGVITIIEGNKNDEVGYRSVPVGWGYIRGYAAPKYDKTEKTTAATQTSTSKAINKTCKWKGKVTASSLNVRTWAGTKNPNIKTYPTIKKGTVVEVCDSIKASDGSKWYYIRINKKIYGFVHGDYIKKA